jgi:2'-5' RNA ligase
VTFVDNLFSMRLFTAIELPRDVCEALIRAQVELKKQLDAKVSWTAQRNLHLTLKFLGEVPDEQVTKLSEALAAIKAPPMSLSLSRLSQLPPNGAAQVLVASVDDPEEALTRLFAAIEDAVEPLGYAREKRMFRPHITLGRMRVPRRVAREIERVTLEPTARFEVGEFVLMKSVLSNSGSQYTKIATIRLL